MESEEMTEFGICQILRVTGFHEGSRPSTEDPPRAFRLPFTPAMFLSSPPHRSISILHPSLPIA